MYAVRIIGLAKAFAAHELPHISQVGDAVVHLEMATQKGIARMLIISLLCNPRFSPRMLNATYTHSCCKAQYASQTSCCA